MSWLWLAPQRQKLNNTIRQYNKNLEPLGLRVIKYGTNGFRIYYKGNNRSFIEVNTRPNLLTANLARGETHPNNRGKGIATAVRTFATALLHNAGYREIKHHGVNFENRNNTSRQKTGNVPITTHIVRKYLGFKPQKYFKSTWSVTNSNLSKLNKAKQMSRRKLKALL
jgi:hypothetical protein